MHERAPHLRLVESHDPEHQSLEAKVSEIMELPATQAFAVMQRLARQLRSPANAGLHSIPAGSAATQEEPPQ